MNIIHRLTLDTMRQGIQAAIPVAQDDTNSHTLVIDFSCDGRQIEIPEGATAAFFGVKSDGNEIFNSCVCYGKNGASPNTVVYTVSADTVSCEGAVEARIIVYSGQSTLYSPCFSLSVEANSFIDSGYSSVSEYSELVNLGVSASDNAGNAEAWAVGEIDGTAVESTDPRYHNNAKYYAELSAGARVLDSSMSPTSQNGVKNSVIKAYVDSSITNAVTAVLNIPI